MNYALLVNPVAGRLNFYEKIAIVRDIADILPAKIYGLKTRSSEEFRDLAKRLSTLFDVLVVAGGDGTFSDVINAVDLNHTILAFLPMGTGNALRFALHYQGSLTDIGQKIKRGTIHQCDLINVDNKRSGFMVSLGYEGTVIQLRDTYRSRGIHGVSSYILSVAGAAIRHFRRPHADLLLDGDELFVPHLFSLMVLKIPYYGMGMKVMPKAKFNDGFLHVAWTNTGLSGAALAATSAFLTGNRFGQYATARELVVRTSHRVALQIDGNQGWTSNEFTFRVLPGVLKLLY